MILTEKQQKKTKTAGKIDKFEYLAGKKYYSMMKEE